MIANPSKRRISPNGVPDDEFDDRAWRTPLLGIGGAIIPDSLSL
jgi:hypothetical protein